MAVVALVVGVWMGLARLGIPLGAPPTPEVHGALLVLGFLGTLIGLERAAAAGRAWTFGVPFLGACSVAAMILGSPRLAAACSLGAGGLLVAVYGAALRTRPADHLVVMTAGAVGWLLAAATWIRAGAVPAIVPWAATFLVATIAGERLELAGLTAIDPAARRLLLGAIGLLFLGATVAWAYPRPGAQLAGIGHLLVAASLLTWDVARRTIRTAGLPRYVAGGLLAGYVWLAVAGLLWLTSGLDPAGRTYDAALHSLFLGFVMSMILAHGPIVLPALTGATVPWHAALWGPLGLLHVSVLLRVAGGLGAAPTFLRVGALGNAAALALFVVVVAVALRRGRRGGR